VIAGERRAAARIFCKNAQLSVMSDPESRQLMRVHVAR
jgi:hypothetical protein